MRIPSFVLLAILLVGCGGRGVPTPPPNRPEPPNEEVTPKEKRQQQQAKSLIDVTPVAAARVLEIIREGQAEGHLPKEPLYLRVRVVNGEYKLDLDPDITAEDHIGESRGVQTVVDNQSALQMAPGTIVDYLADVGGFKIKPPSTVELGSPDVNTTLAEARRGFKTNLIRRNPPGKAPAPPPSEIFSLVKYDSPVGKLHAYLTPDPKDGVKRPAMVWITGGDCNTIDRGCWREGEGGMDQSASVYRKAGLVMMFPSQRGGNDNPGPKEAFFGEVEDIIAAADYLAKQPHVDANRIYLGGHSTGGTLALLVSEYTDRFRAVFSFGPVGDLRGYGPDQTPFSLNGVKEVRLRAPELWLHSIRSPTFVIEGSEAPGNIGDLQRMARMNKNDNCRFYEVKGANHFNLLSSLNQVIAERIVADKGPKCNITLTEEEVNAAFKKSIPKNEDN